MIGDVFSGIYRCSNFIPFFTYNFLPTGFQGSEIVYQPSTSTFRETYPASEPPTQPRIAGEKAGARPVLAFEDEATTGGFGSLITPMNGSREHNDV